MRAFPGSDFFVEQRNPHPRKHCAATRSEKLRRLVDRLDHKEVGHRLNP